MESQISPGILFVDLQDLFSPYENEPILRPIRWDRKSLLTLDLSRGHGVVSVNGVITLSSVPYGVSGGGGSGFSPILSLVGQPGRATRVEALRSGTQPVPGNRGHPTPPGAPGRNRRRPEASSS